MIFPLFRSGGLWSKYSNPAFDAEVDAARRVLDETKRLEHYRKAFEILRDDVPGIGSTRTSPSMVLGRKSMDADAQRGIVRDRDEVGLIILA